MKLTEGNNGNGSSNGGAIDRKKELARAIVNGDMTSQALEHLALELSEAKLPSVLSSYMTGKNLPEEYRGIEKYVKEVRKRMIDDIGGEPTQLQMIVLDGICETLLVLKYISTFIGEAPDSNIIGFNRLGVPVISDVAVRGFANFHAVLDKKVKQFHDMTSEMKNALSPREIHRRAMMSEALPTGRPLNENKEKPIRDAKERETQEMAEMSEGG